MVSITEAELLNRDDSFIVSPFKDAFQFIPDVPYDMASKVLAILNAGPNQKRRDLSTQDFGFAPMTGDACPDGTVPHEHDILKPRSIPLTRGLHRRQTTPTTPGYTTTGNLPFNSLWSPASNFAYVNPR